MDDAPVTPGQASLDEELERDLATEKSYREHILTGLADAEAGRLIPHAEVVAGIQNRRRWRAGG
jgi:predicted transcriptional regulator